MIKPLSKKLLTTNEFTDLVITLGTKYLKSWLIRSEAAKIIVDTLNKFLNKSKIYEVSTLWVNESWGQLNWINKLFCKLLINNAKKDHVLLEDAVLNSLQMLHIICTAGLKNIEVTNKINIKHTDFLPNNDFRKSNDTKCLIDSTMTYKTVFSSICKAWNQCKSKKKS